MAGLNGWFSKLWKGVAIALTTAAFGPIGAAIAGGLIALGEEKGWWRGLEPNAYVQQQVLFWRDTVYIPFMKKVLNLVSGTPTAPSYVKNLNENLEKLAAWQAYYEFIISKTTDEDEVAIAQEKIGLISTMVELIKTSYLKEAPLPGLAFYPYIFDPTKHGQIGTEQLKWSGVKSIEATKLTLTDKPDPKAGGGTTTGGGGTTTGGGGTTTGGGGTTTGGGGTTTGGGGTTTGGGGTTTGGGGTTTGGGGTTTGGGGTTTGGGGTGGTKPPVTTPPHGNVPPVQRPIEYFRLSLEEKKIYTEWEKDGLTYYYAYRRQNPSYKPTPELLKLIGLTVPAPPPTRQPNPNNPWNYLPKEAPKSNKSAIVAVLLVIGAAFLIRNKK
jgi:hypothetical protein